MFKKMKFIIYTRPFIAFIYYFIRLYSLTFRFQVKHEDQWQKLLKQGNRILLCGWHQQFFAAIGHFKKYSCFHPALMISRSRDGELISGVANRTGWHTARGSSSRSGKQAMDEMIHHLNQYDFGAHILDGPQGPMGKVKGGVIKMAMESRAVLVPFYTSSNSAWFFNSWDRFMLPKPFSKVTLTFGEPICFEPPGTADEFEKQRQELEDTMKSRLFS